ncbi:hypothetical protein [Gimesia maris]|uniref:hypothetical protein n=1 Tax=Gimesia maris TaxID=122 RepID=UPI0030D8E9FC|tara:strand:- start:19456 stop:20265 length:810 start_codon:yes stop_codon:yes gene_type:complete
MEVSKRYQIIGSTINNAMAINESCVNGFDKYRIKSQTYCSPYRRRSTISDGMFLMTMYHLQYDMPSDLILSDYINECVDIGVEYFCGELPEDEEDRLEVIKAPDNEDLVWIDPFSQGLFCALLLNREQEIEKLCSWVEADLYLDGGLSDMEEHSHYLYMSIAAELRSAPMPGIEDKEAAIEQCRKKRSKLLYSVWQAVRNKDQVAFNKAFEESLKHYEKYDLGKEYATDWIAQNQSLLWLLAERNGLSFPELPEKLAAMVVTRETLGLE